jgi:hypothetical protein
MNRMFISPATGRTGPHALGLALAALGAALLLMPTLALAHGSGKGAGSFFSGAVHPLREPAHALALMTLGLWTGQRGIDESHPSLPCFGLALLLCLWLASTGINLDVDFALYVAAATMGIAVAISMKVPTLMRASVAGLVGAGIGLGSRPDAATGLEHRRAGAGIVVGGQRLAGDGVESGWTAGLMSCNAIRLKSPRLR